MSQPVYANLNKAESFEIDIQIKRKRTGRDSVKIRSCRTIIVCLALLCFLLLTAVTLSVYIYKNYKNYTEEKGQLLINITDLTEQRDDLMNQITFFEKEDRWTYNQSSVYFMSSEMKTWTESRQDCKERGADLVIINNQQEQDFVLDLSRDKEFWIGLTDQENEGRWKWVGDSKLDSGFWASKEPNGGKLENCVLTHLKRHPELLGWLDHSCDYVSQWICEKSIFPPAIQT